MSTREEVIKKSLLNLEKTRVGRGFFNRHARKLVEIEAKEAIPDLISLLKDKNKKTGARRDAVYILTELKAEEAIPIFIEVLEETMKKEFSFLPDEIVDSLVFFNAPQSREILEKAVGDGTLSVASKALDAIAKLGFKESVDKIVFEMNYNSSESIQIKAIKTLVKLDAKNKADAIISLIGSKYTNKNARKAAMNAAISLELKEAIFDIVRVSKRNSRLQEDEEEVISFAKSASRELAKVFNCSTGQQLIDLIESEEQQKRFEEKQKIAFEEEKIKNIELQKLAAEKQTKEDERKRIISEILEKEKELLEKKKIADKLVIEGRELLELKKPIDASKKFSLAIENYPAHLEAFELSIQCKPLFDEYETIRKKRILDEIIKTKQSIKIEELTSLLEFNDKLEMQKWLLLLNEKIPFIFDRENVYVSDISHELNISYSTVEESIDLLLESFNKKEKTGQSKKEN